MDINFESRRYFLVRAMDVGVLTPTPPIEGTERLPSNSPT
jgi:hypothetical protein